MDAPLSTSIAVVCGATRGAGRGIATALGEAGATVYCVGRSTRQRPRTASVNASPFALAHRPETIEATVERVNDAGGVGIAHRADLSEEAEARGLFQRVKDEQGRLDLLVNSVWGGDQFTDWGTPFWELDLDRGFTLLRQAIDTHIIASRYGAPLMVAQGAGLIVEITDGADARYRGNLFYDLAKASVIRLAHGMAEELRPHGVAALALTPGFLRSEAMLDHFGVTESTWRDAIEQDPHFAASETPLFVGRAVAALAADPAILGKSGEAFTSWDLAKGYGFTDADGSRPDWGAHFAEHVAS